MSKRDGKYWDESWNPIKDSRGGYHCTKCSPGCLNCWAESMNIGFFHGMGYTSDFPPRQGFILDEKVLNGNVFNGRPKTIFVCDLCDLFHPEVPDSFIERVFETMERHKQHRFLVLTKRWRKMYEFFSVRSGPSEHIWPGATVCNQDEMDRLDVGGIRWLSIEPILGPVNLQSAIGNQQSIEWVTIGEESLGYKPGRPSSPDGFGWHSCVKPIVEQCRMAGLPVWVKQIHLQGELIKNIERLPVDVRVREWPEKQSKN